MKIEDLRSLRIINDALHDIDKLTVPENVELASEISNKWLHKRDMLETSLNVWKQPSD